MPLLEHAAGHASYIQAKRGDPVLAFAQQELWFGPMTVLDVADEVKTTRRAILTGSSSTSLAALLLSCHVKYAAAVPSRRGTELLRSETSGQERGASVGAGAGSASMSLPPTPSLPPSAEVGFAPFEGGRIFHATSGRGRPVVFLHGGLANANYWGHQFAAVSADQQAVAIDFMGHGRSSLAAPAITYASLARSVVGVMDHLRIPKAVIVGWSDGGIVGLELALRHTGRVEGIFCLGTNYDRTGLIPGGGEKGAFREYARRAGLEYMALSPQPRGYQNLRRLMSQMWSTEPNFSRRELATIRVPTVIAAGEFDEIIRRDHTQELAAAIPGSRLVIEPRTSHFAMLQDPGRMTTDLLTFIQSLS